jgi:hypothetical protein
MNETVPDAAPVASIATLSRLVKCLFGPYIVRRIHHFLIS